MTQQQLGAGVQILDYCLIEKLGAGGYGEVWSAEGPGGLKKAVKVVFGVVTDKRAERELKALERIKETRHPFLLSLERIEVCDDRLVIVTELADCSLKQVFRKHRRGDLPGIPREELLIYIGDAAEALDFMRESHSLQHLDVKPENLLLVGGRIKVADFGLVKQLGDVSASMMGGLTPAYASPETFDDRPSPRSDQYSLAIVYMEMLTGLLPFSGKTAAQLAKQHIMNRPNLVGLPERDHQAIERALSKEPARRFESCRELTHALRSATRPGETAASATRIGPANSGMAAFPSEADSKFPISITNLTATSCSNPVVPQASDTQSFKMDTMPVQVLPNAPNRHFFGNQTARQLPPLDLPPLHSSLRPTVFVGLGGMAGSMIYRIRRRLADRFGDPQRLPAFDSLVIDSDLRQLTELTSTPDMARLHPSQTVPVPLKRPEEYRKSSRKLLHWLSRRWLYNVPRSLQTEGMRPLGRLALVDNAEAVFSRLKQSVTEVRKPANMQLTATRMGQEFGTTTPQIVLISSICGGTSSGMLLDILYALRMMVADMPNAEDAVLSFLLYGTDRASSNRDLAKANAYATLSELMHFHVQDGYPGEISCGLPGFRSPPIQPHDSYFLHLGDHLSQNAWDKQLELAAEYVYQATATPASVALTAGRKATRSSDLSPSTPLFRTVGLRRLGVSAFALADEAAGACMLNLLCCWLGETPRDMPKDLRRLIKATQADMHPNVEDTRTSATEFCQELNCSLESVSEYVRKSLEKAVGSSLEVYTERIRVYLAGTLKHQGVISPAQLSQYLPTYNRLFQPVAEDHVPEHELFEIHLHEQIQKAITAWTTDRSQALRHEAFQKVNQPANRLAIGHLWIQSQLKYFLDREAESKQLASRSLEECTALTHRIREFDEHQDKKRGSKTPLQFEDPRKLLAEFVNAKLRAAIASLFPAALLAIRGSLSAALDTLTDMRRELRQMLGSVDISEDWLDNSAPPTEELEDANRQRMVELVKADFAPLAKKLDVVLQEGVLNASGGLVRALTANLGTREQLFSIMRAAARELVFEFLKRSKLVDPLADLYEPERRELLTQQLRRILQLATPIPLAWGGAKRLFGFVSSSEHEGPLARLLREELRELSATVCFTEGEDVICFEGEQISLMDIAAGLVEDRADIPDGARRIHTRIDVEWLPLRDCQIATR